MRSLIKLLFVVPTVFSLLLISIPSLAAQSADLEYTQFDGKRFKIEDYRGKLVIVGFWATWCNVCKKEMPWVNKYYKNNDGKYELIMISLDDSEDQARAYLEDKNYTFPAAWRWEKDSRDNLGKVIGTPTAILIDKGGNIVKRSTGSIPVLDWMDYEGS